MSDDRNDTAERYREGEISKSSPEWPKAVLLMTRGGHPVYLSHNCLTLHYGYVSVSKGVWRPMRWHSDGKPVHADVGVLLRVTSFSNLILDQDCVVAET